MSGLAVLGVLSLTVVTYYLSNIVGLLKRIIQLLEIGIDKQFPR